MKFDVIENKQTNALVLLLLVGYAVIGLILSGFYWFDGKGINFTFGYFVVYVLIPSFLCYRLLFATSSRTTQIMLTVFLAMGVLRFIGPQAFWPWNPPISLAFAITDFEQGQGVLIDLLPICALLLQFGFKGKR